MGMRMPTSWPATCRATPKQNFNRINDISYNTYEGFVQDSWKVNSKLTVEARSAHDPLHALDGR